MTQSFESLLTWYQYLRHVGESILVAGLVGDFLVIGFLHGGGRRERIGSLIGTALILAGVGIENIAGSRIDEVIDKMRAPRSLSAEQQARIVVRLKQFAGTPFELRVFNDPEALSLMNVIAGTLRAAEWNLLPAEGETIMLSTEYDEVALAFHVGVQIQADPRAPALRALAEVVTDALRAEGVGAATVLDSLGQHPERVRISIGKKE